MIRHSLAGRMSFMFLVAILFLTVVRQATAGVNTWTPLGPEKAEILSLVAEPFESGTLYAVTWGGIYKSSDSGETWIFSSRGIEPGPMRALAIDPHIRGSLYAATGNDVYKSSDGGAIWHKVLSSPTRTSTCVFLKLAVDAFDFNRVYAAGDRGVFVSDSAGQDWRVIASGLDVISDEGRIIDLAVSLRTPGRLLAVGQGWLRSLGPPGAVYECHEGGFFASNNGGETWSHCGEGLPKLCSGSITAFVNAVTVHPVVPEVMYAGTSKGLFRSTDEGNTWEDRQSDSVRLVIDALSVAADDPNTVYATNNSGKGVVQKTTDGGLTWHEVLNEYVTALLTDPRSPRTVYAGGQQFLFKSTDGGLNWSRTKIGLFNQSITYLTFDPRHPSSIYTSENISRDGGLTWQGPDPGNQWGAVDLVVDLENSQLLYGVGYSELKKSTDGGQTWQWAGLVEGALLRLILDPSQAGRMYAVGNNIYRVDDRAQAITTLYQGGSGTSIRSLVLWPDIPDLLLAAGSFWIGSVQSNLILRSTDGGVTWNRAETGLPGGKPAGECVIAPVVTDLAIDPLNESVVLAASSTGFYRSTDYGSTWTAVPMPSDDQSFTSLLFDPDIPTTVYMGTEKGKLLASADSGRTWAPFEPALPARSQITRIVIIPGRAKRILAGTAANSAWEISRLSGDSVREQRRGRRSSR